MRKEWLPIGSVVTLEEAQRKLMIIGISIQREGDEKVYDYIGVPFPEGYVSSELMLLFMHDDIESVDYLGFINAEVQIFRSKIQNNN